MLCSLRTFAQSIDATVLLVMQAAGNAFADAHNEALSIVLAEFAEDHLEASLITFDFATFLSDSIQNASALGFNDTATPCYTGAIAGFSSALPDPTAVCTNPDQHLFWDGVHPTGRAHQLWGEAIAAQIRPILTSASRSTPSRKLLQHSVPVPVDSIRVHGGWPL